MSFLNARKSNKSCKTNQTHLSFVEAFNNCLLTFHVSNPNYITSGPIRVQPNPRLDILMQKWIVQFFTCQSNPRSLGSWCIKGTRQSTLGKILSVYLMHYDLITTVFIDTRLWKTKHHRKRFQNARQSYVLSTHRIEFHQSQPR